VRATDPLHADSPYSTSPGHTGSAPAGEIRRVLLYVATVFSRSGFRQILISRQKRAVTSRPELDGTGDCSLFHHVEPRANQLIAETCPKCNGGAWAIDFCYSSRMGSDPKQPRKLTPIWRAVVEIGFIIFLLYANLLMREFTNAGSEQKSLGIAVQDIFTATNLEIATISALLGYLVLEYIRMRS
jgi:hypothetical protein